VVKLVGAHDGKNLDVGNASREYSAKRFAEAPLKETELPKEHLRPQTIVVAGSARLPKSVSATNGSGCISIELEIDPVDAVIVDISCTSVPSLGTKILQGALLGNRFGQGIEEAIVELNRRFFSVRRRAVIAALKDSSKWYKKFLEKNAVRNMG
jgi:hypothetical protein